MFKSKKIQLILGLLISILAIIIILYKIDLYELKNAFFTADWRNWIAVFIFYLLFMFVRAIRWRLLLGREIKLFSIFNIQNIGYLFSNILPFRAGDLIRAYLVSKKNDLSVMYSLSSVVLERVLDMIVIIVFFCIGVVFAPDLPNYIEKSAVCFFCITVVTVVLLFLIARFKEKFINLIGKLLKIFPIQIRNWIINGLDGFIDAILNLNSIFKLVKILFFSFFIWIIALLAFYFGLSSFNIIITWGCVFFTLSVAMLGMSIPSSPSGIGVFHLSILIGLSVFGIPDNISIAFGLIYHAFSLVLAMILGIVGLVLNDVRFNYNEITEQQLK